MECQRKEDPGHRAGQETSSAVALTHCGAPHATQHAAAEEADENEKKARSDWRKASPSARQLQKIPIIRAPTVSQFPSCQTQETFSFSCCVRFAPFPLVSPASLFALSFQTLLARLLFAVALSFPGLCMPVFYSGRRLQCVPVAGETFLLLRFPLFLLPLLGE